MITPCLKGMMTNTCEPGAGRLEAELLAVTKRATTVASMLPRDVTPVNLEVLRRLKLALVELESKAASLRCRAPLPGQWWPPGSLPFARAV